MSEISFDVNLISQINFRPSYCSDTYKWREDELIPKYKKVLLFFKVGDGFEVKPAGFYEERTHHYDFDGDRKYYLHITEEYLIKCGYLIKEFGNHDGISYRKEVWIRAYVEVSLGYKSAIGNSFDTDQEAKDWIDKLKETSGKTFEVITH
jgi:hypothetical protein